MKGVELPLNMMIIIAVVLLVLLGILSLWTGGWVGQTRSVDLETARAKACAELIRRGCEPNVVGVQIDDFDADQDGRIDPGNWITTGCAETPPASIIHTADNLHMLCYCWYRIPLLPTTEFQFKCKKLCGCPYI